MSSKISDLMQSEERMTTEEITKGDISGKMCLYFSQSGQQVTIKKRIIAGRKRNADIDLRAYFKTESLTGISRRHFEISPNEDGTPTLVIKDLNSRNGTEVDGQRLSPGIPKILRHGCKVRLAKNDDFRFVIIHEDEDTIDIEDKPPKEGIYYDEDERQFFVDGKPIRGLAPLELELLEYLYQNMGKACTYDELVEEVWKGGVITNAAIATAIRRLRNKLYQAAEGGGDYIKTIYGRGYQLSNQK